MSNQQYFVAKGQTIRGPVTNRKRAVNPVTGKIAFSGESGKVYTSHDRQGNPIALPQGFVDYLKANKDTNGQTKLQNMIDSGYIVFTAGAASPVQFAKPLPVEMTSKDGVIIEAK